MQFLQWFFAGAPPHPYYWALIVLWAVVYYLSCAPSRDVLETDKLDRNSWRQLFQVMAIVVVPPLALDALTDKFEEVYFFVGLAIYFVGRGLAQTLAVAGPDAEWELDFRYWAQILRDGELQHFFRSLVPRRRLGYLLFCVLVFAVYLAFALLAWNIAARGDDLKHAPAIFEVSTALLTFTAAWTFVVTLVVSHQTLGMHSVSFPVRYSFLASTIHIYMCSLWAAIYPFIAFVPFDNRFNLLRLAVIVIGAVAVYGFVVVRPVARWRLRFRAQREQHLLLFSRILRRLGFATEPGNDHLPPLGEYRQDSRRKAVLALQFLLRDIVQFSPFRAFIMLNHDAQARLMYEQYQTAAPSNPYQAAVVDWLKEEDANSRKTNWRDKRVLSALRIRNPHLQKMIERRYVLEQGDYRYRMMYWIARVLEKSNPQDAPYLHPLSREALEDMQEVAKRHDQRSLLLATAGAGVVAFGAILAALGRELLNLLGEIVVRAGHALHPF